MVGQILSVCLAVLVRASAGAHHALEILWMGAGDQIYFQEEVRAKTSG
jgi:hypothetical protein